MQELAVLKPLSTGIFSFLFFMRNIIFYLSFLLTCIFSVSLVSAHSGECSV